MPEIAPLHHRRWAGATVWCEAGVYIGWNAVDLVGVWNWVSGDVQRQCISDLHFRYAGEIHFAYLDLFSMDG